MRPTAQKKKKKKIPFKIFSLTKSAPGHPRAQIEVEKINLTFMPTKHNIHSAAHGSRRIFSLKSYNLGNAFHKAVASMDSNSSDGSGQSQLKSFWKVFTILSAIKNICDSWEEIKISTLTRAWKNLINHHGGL